MHTLKLSAYRRGDLFDQGNSFPNASLMKPQAVLERLPRRYPTQTYLRHHNLLAKTVFLRDNSGFQKITQRPVS
ncbi:hypothetical protein [Gracilimonas mengyeensis]|uniref:hypothetical protein n=1 Tax=Gracilimonas mengyeensis TaxID=1302730 RepID=UPI00163D9EA7|nr:hypothetical protein [Gracilimonas mengyeensis]